MSKHRVPKLNFSEEPSYAYRSISADRSARIYHKEDPFFSRTNQIDSSRNSSILPLRRESYTSDRTFKPQRVSFHNEVVHKSRNAKSGRSSGFLPILTTQDVSYGINEEIITTQRSLYDHSPSENPFSTHSVQTNEDSPDNSSPITPFQQPDLQNLSRELNYLLTAPLFNTNFSFSQSYQSNPKKVHKHRQTDSLSHYFPTETMSVVSQPPVPTNSSKAVVTALLNLKPKKRAANPRVGADFEALRTFINDRVEQRSGKKRIQKGQVDPTELDTDPIIPNDMLMENMYSTKQIQQSKFEPLFQHTRYVESLSDINRSERPKTQEFCLTHRSEYRRQHNSASPTHKYLSRPNTSRHTQKAGSPPSFSSTKISRAQQNTPPLMVPALFTASPPKHGRTQPLIESARSFNKEHFDRGTAILKQNELRREEALQARLKKGQSYFEAEQAFLNDKPDFVSKTDQQPFAPAAHASPYAPSNMPLSYAYHRPHPSARKRAATNTNTDPVSVPKERFNKQVVMRWVLLMKCAAYVGAVQNAFEEDRAKRTIKLTLARQFRNELRELKERRKTEQRRDALIKAGVIGRTLGQVGLRLQTLQMNRFAENLRVFLFDVRANMMLRVRLLQFRQCIIEAQRLERSRRQCRNARLLIFDTLWSSTEAFLLRGGQDPTDFVPSTMLYPSSYKQQKIKQSDTIEEQLAFLNSIDLPKPPVEETVAPHKTLHVEYDLSALLSKTDAQSREAEILLPFQTAIQKGRQKFSSTKSTSAQTNGGKSRPLPALSRGISSSTLRTLDSGDSNDAPEQEAPPQTFVLHSNDSMLRLLAPSVGPKLSSPSIVMDTPTSKVNSPSLTPSSSKALLRSRSHASLKNPKSIQSRKSLVTNPNFTQPSSQSQFSSYVPKPIRYSIMTRRMNLIRKHHLLHVEKGDFFVPYFGLMKKIMIDMVLEGMETTLNQSVVPS